MTLKQRKPILLIDQDDVLAEYISGVTNVFNQEYHTAFKEKDCVCWDLVAIFGKEITEVMHRPELFRNLVPVTDALETFERLYRSELFEMYIVTAAHPSSVEAKYEWLEQYMPFFPKTNIIVCSAKYMIKGDYLLDDGMHNIEAFQGAGGKSVIFDRAHNNQEPTPGYARVNGWLEFEEFIMNECYQELLPRYFDQMSKEDKAV